MPSPIAFAPDQRWDGIDGSWSSFSVRVGTPAQVVRTFVSWSLYQTWVVVPSGCTWATDQNACAQSRGNLFDPSKSSTWDDIGVYAWPVEGNLGYDGNSENGYDVVGLGARDSDGPTLKNTTVGGFALTEFYMGIFGINPKPTNFTSFQNESPSYMTLLKEQNYTPSVSFGYTAGAQYRSTSDYASLTLGGYDSSKFVENDVEWTFGADNERDIVVAVQSVHTPSQDASNPTPIELLPNAIYAYLDATVPQIWLPVEACEVFEYEFGLVYDNTTELYLVNDTLHQQLLNRNASVTFSLAVASSGGETVDITLPYAAFDLTAKSPYQGLDNDSYYFPLKRAANDTQYTIGRTFFQEAYITIDYERQKFNVSQLAQDRTAPANLVTIPPFSEEAGAGLAKSSSKGLSGGAIAGIAVGAVAVIALLAIGLLWFFHRRRRSAKKAAQHEKLGSDDGSAHNERTGRRGEQTNVLQKAELDGSSPANGSLHAAGALSAPNSGSASDSPRTPHMSGSTWYNRTQDSSAYSPTSSGEEGTGTHSSNESSSRGNGTMYSAISPIAPSPANEIDSKERQIHEMPGDMPTIKEKDGKLLSEKEALAHRERVYNGVETPPQSDAEPKSAVEREKPQMVNPEDVARSNTVIGSGQQPQERRDFQRHRAFSFEEARKENKSSEDLYSAE